MSPFTQRTCMAATVAALALGTACQRFDRTHPLTAPTGPALDVNNTQRRAPGPTYPPEHAYYNGRIYRFTFPSQMSNDQREFIIGCWRVGIPPKFAPAHATVDMYAIFMPGATLHWCPGQPTVGLHDHLLSAIPRTPGYSSDWHIWDVDPGPNLAPDGSNSPMPITSIPQLKAAEAAGLVVIVDDSVDFQAAVTGPAQ